MFLWNFFQFVENVFSFYSCVSICTPINMKEHFVHETKGDDHWFRYVPHATCHVPRSCGGKRVSSLCLRQIILSLRPYWLHHKYMQMLIFNGIILMYIVSNLQLSFTLTFVLCVFFVFFRFLKFEWQVMTIRAVLLPASVIGHSSRIPVLRDVRNNHLGV